MDGKNGFVWIGNLKSKSGLIFNCIGRDLLVVVEIWCRLAKIKEQYNSEYAYNVH